MRVKRFTAEHSYDTVLRHHRWQNRSLPRRHNRARSARRLPQRRFSEIGGSDSAMITFGNRQ